MGAAVSLFPRLHHLNRDDDVEAEAEAEEGELREQIDRVVD